MTQLQTPTTPRDLTAQAAAYTPLTSPPPNHLWLPPECARPLDEVAYGIGDQRDPFGNDDIPVTALATPEASYTISNYPAAEKIYRYLMDRRCVRSLDIGGFTVGRPRDSREPRQDRMQLSVTRDPINGHSRVNFQIADGRFSGERSSRLAAGPTFVVEPQEYFDPVLVRFDKNSVSLHAFGNHNRFDPNNEGPVVEFKLPKPPSHANPEIFQREQQAYQEGYEVMAELRRLCEKRLVNIDIKAKSLGAHLADNPELIDTVLNRKKREYIFTRRKASEYVIELASIPSPPGYGDEMRRYHRAHSFLCHAGVDHETGEALQYGLLAEIEKLFAAHGRTLIAAPEYHGATACSRLPISEASKQIDPQERFLQLTDLQAMQPRVEVTTREQELGQIETPHQWAYRLAELVRVNGMTVLDPTAGKGLLLHYAGELGAKKCFGYEIDSSIVDAAHQQGHDIRHADFRDVPTRGATAQCVLMNLPVIGGADYRDTRIFLEKTLNRHWSRTGNAGIILPAHSRATEYLQPWRELIINSQELPFGTFRRDGRNVPAMLYILKGVGTDPGWHMRDLRTQLSGAEVQVLMRQSGETIRSIAERHQIYLKTVRAARDSGVKGLANVADWIERITGVFPDIYRPGYNESVRKDG